MTESSHGSSNRASMVQRLIILIVVQIICAVYAVASVAWSSDVSVSVRASLAISGLLVMVASVVAGVYALIGVLRLLAEPRLDAKVEQ